MSYSMSDLLQLMVSEGAADLHIRTGIPPAIRVHGTLHKVEGPALTPDDTEDLMRSISSEDKQKYEEALEVDLEQEIFPETKDLRELESLESSDATLVSTEKVSESSPEGAENSTDPQDEQSAANLQFLQERYNRIANAALEEGKLELAKDCYDSLAKILRLMK